MQSGKTDAPAAKSPLYIVLVGDAGAGKSTVVEKLTGKTGRSSKASGSFTRTSEPFYVPDRSLIVSDTPGSNSRKEKLQHNIWIASALNFMPVSKIFIVVKASDRIDSVIDDIRKYADSFLEFPMDVVGVLVTHMDTVEWMESELKSDLEEDLGIATVVVSGSTTTGSTLLANILKTCKEKPEDLNVDGENFLKLFKIHTHDRRILKCTNDEIERFRAIKKAFNVERTAYGNKDQVDLIFEFQAYMKDEIVRAQKRLSERHNFSFFGEKAANEAGHVANLANQLRAILYDIRMECLSYQNDQSESELRRCTHCPRIWAKVEGCDNTTCGAIPSTTVDLRSSEFAILATYSFRWLNMKLDIEKSGEKKVTSSQTSAKRGVGEGCGKSITWSEMPLADVPREFRETSQISTSDIKVLPPAASGFQENLSEMIDSLGKNMKLS